MQQAFDGGIESVWRMTGDDCMRGRRQQIGPERFAGLIITGVLDSADRIFDRVIPGAPAQIALERSRQILALLLAEPGSGHDHARGTETALKAGRLHEGLLHRMQVAVLREPFDSGYLFALGTERGNQAAMNRHAVEPYGARAAVSRVTSLLDAEPAQLANERSQALSRPGLLREGLAVDLITHG